MQNANLIIQNNEVTVGINGAIDMFRCDDFRLGELFCGPGGIAWGAKKASVELDHNKHQILHAWATDYDKDTCDTYAKNICNGKSDSVICADIRNLNLNKLADISEIDALAFGFPCNDFSIVGEQKGIDGHFGPLYSYGIQAIEKFQPQWFLAENVGGLKNANEGRAFHLILQSMFDAGYSVYPHLYAFNEYGVPQTRNRIIIIGIRQDIDVIFKIPSPEPYNKCDVSSRTALEKKPISSNAPNNENTKQSINVIERLKYIKPGENAFTAQMPKNLQLNIKGAKISQIYKRLNPDKPAYTVTGSGGGGTHMYHWSEDRALTNRERARLQTFPDNFVFCGSKESVRKQIGMAVPCNGAQIVFEAVLASFAGVHYDSINYSIESLIQKKHLSLYNTSTNCQVRIMDKGKKKYE